MLNRFAFTLLLGLPLLLLCPGTGFGDSPSLVPVTWECTNTIANEFGIPLPLLLGIMRTEGGEVGMISENRNGSYDIGPMQINTLWLPKTRGYGISDAEILFNGCTNVAVGAWILSDLLQRYPLWEAVGYYHSRTQHLSKGYASRVFKNSISLDTISKCVSVINRANKGISRE